MLGKSSSGGSLHSFIVTLFLLLGLQFLTLSTARAQGGVAGDIPAVAPNKEQADKTDSSKQATKIIIQTNLVTAPVTVINSNGDFVYDLQKSDFELFDNGVPQQIDRFDMELNKVSLVIVVEDNDFVAPLLEDVRPLAPLFSELLLGPQGQAAVITYGNGVHLVQEFTDSSARLDTALRGLRGRGDSFHLNEALARALSLLEKRPKDERRVIVVFSDGHDIGGESGKGEIVRRATNSEVTIYGVGFNPAKAMLSRQPKAPMAGPLEINGTLPTPPGEPHTPSMEQVTYDTPIPIVPIILATGEVVRSVVAKNLVEFYAGYTGGVYYSHWAKKAVQDELNMIATEVHSQYELAYVPDTLSQSGFHRIQVKVGRPGVRVRARAGYFYAGPTQ